MTKPKTPAKPKTPSANGKPKTSAPTMTPPAPQEIDTELRLRAAFLIQEPDVQHWIEEQKRFLFHNLGEQSWQNDLTDLAGLRFLCGAVSVLNRVSGLED